MAGRQAKRDESVRSGSRVGGLGGPSHTPSIFLSRSPFGCGRRSPQEALGGDVDLGGQDSLQGCVSLGGSWTSLCRLTACRVPRPRSVLLTCWWLPIPPPPWLSSALPVSTEWRVGGRWGARAKRRVTSIHPSPAPGREWELGLQSGQAEVALNVADHGAATTPL